jgi:3-oxoacyl-[acyl-carrier protein] reductase
VAIVAAASKGLGLAVAKELARDGAQVAICARSEDELARAASESRGVGNRNVFAEKADVTDPAAIARSAGAVERSFGRVDICITNSGGPPSKIFADTTLQDWRAAADLLLVSALTWAHQVLPRMKRNQWGGSLRLLPMP